MFEPRDELHARVRPIGTQQVIDDPLLDAERTGEQRQVDLLVGGRGQDARAAEAAARRECRANLRLLRQVVAAQQPQDQVDGRPPPGDVVLQVAIEALVAQVDVRREADQDDVLLAGRQSEELAELDQPLARRGVRCVRTSAAPSGPPSASSESTSASAM